MNLGARTAAWQSGLPYDAEVEYLKSNAAQYIDSGLEANWKLRVELDIQALVAGNTSFGAAYINGSTTIRHHFGPAETDIFCGPIASSYLFSSHYKMTERAKYIIDPLNHIAYRNSVSYGFNYGDNWTTGMNYLLFARNRTDTSINLSKWCVFGELKMFSGGVLKVDAIPVRKGTVGYLYNKVTGKLMTTTGTPFTGDMIGPDL